MNFGDLVGRPRGKPALQRVETHERATLLKLVKCDEAQGFLFSRPAPPAEIENLLQSAAPVLQVQR